jgi:hypothetical protein
MEHAKGVQQLPSGQMDKEKYPVGYAHFYFF